MVMQRFGEDYVMEQDLMNTIASYMDDEKREQVHAELAPCTHEQFLVRYLELDPEFEALLAREFGIDIVLDADQA